MNEFSIKWLVNPFPFTGSSYGFKGPTRALYTIYQVNLKRMLGAEYDKYDYFKLNLLSITTSRFDLISPLNSPEDANLYINISGLNFINPNNNDGSHKIASFFYDTTKLSKTYYDDNYVIFSKSNFPNVNIYFTRVLDDTVPTSTYSNHNFYFSISGVLI